MSDIPDIYTNSIRMAASIYEITIILDLLTPLKDNVESKEVARIRMSPQQAMALHLLLDKHLKVYGEQFREIFLPDELVKRLSGSEEIGDTKDEHKSDGNS